jgi:hypothetical protein
MVTYNVITRIKAVLINTLTSLLVIVIRSPRKVLRLLCVKLANCFSHIQAGCGCKSRAAHSCSRGLVVRRAVKPEASVALVFPSGLL